MQSNTKSVKQGESNLFNVGKPTVYSDPWWSSNAGYNPISPAVMQGPASDSSSLEQSVDGHSHSEAGTGINEEDDDTTKRSRRATPLHSVSTKMVAQGNSGVSPKAAEIAGGGLIISITDVIRKFLSAASTDSYLSKDIRDLSSSLTMHSTVPYKSLKTIWLTSKDTRPDLNYLLSGSSFIFTSPKPREKSEELKVRLKKLQEAAERKEYAELVKDITPKKVVEEPFSSYKDQLGFGLHVVVAMFTGYLVGYFAFRALFNHSPAMNVAGGILGLVGAMLVETLLFILRAASNQDRQSPSSTSSSKLNIKKNQ